MKHSLWPLAGLLTFAMCAAALAQAVAAQPTIPVAPWVDILSPYVSIVAQAVAVTLAGFLCASLNRWLGVKTNAAEIEKLKSAAATQAGVLVAAAANGLRGQSITVGSQGVADAARIIAARLPDTARAVGATPEALKEFVAGEIGKLQAAQPGSPSLSK